MARWGCGPSSSIGPLAVSSARMRPGQRQSPGHQSVIGARDRATLCDRNWSPLWKPPPSAELEVAAAPAPDPRPSVSRASELSFQALPGSWKSSRPIEPAPRASPTRRFSARMSLQQAVMQCGALQQPSAIGGRQSAASTGAGCCRTLSPSRYGRRADCRNAGPGATWHQFAAADCAMCPCSHPTPCAAALRPAARLPRRRRHVAAAAAAADAPPRRVVVTGQGVVSSLGHSPEEFYMNLLAGRSGISMIEGWDTGGRWGRGWQCVHPPALWAAACCGSLLEADTSPAPARPGSRACPSWSCKPSPAARLACPSCLVTCPPPPCPPLPLQRTSARGLRGR